MNLTISELRDDVHKAIHLALRSLHLAQLQIHSSPVYLNLQPPKRAQLQANRQSLDHLSVLLVEAESCALSGQTSLVFIGLSFEIL